MNQTILLKQRPVGKPTLSDFDFVNEESNVQPKEGEILLETTYISVDPYLRGRMSSAKSYVAPFEVGKPISSGIVAKVIASKNTDFKEGDYVSGLLAWKTKQISTGEGLNKIDPNKVPLSAYLGVVGMTGLTAYCGLTEIGKPKEGETLVVSGAAGAVGTIVGQIGKILGLRVIGIAGSDEKVDMLTSEFGYDEAINYKTTKNIKEAIEAAAPNGVDIYFDNVGGDISEAVLYNINHFARIIVCGAISVYNKTEPQKNETVQPFIVKNSALMQGFIVSNYASKFPEAIQQLATWIAEDKLKYTETIVDGFANTPQAFIDLLDGKNKGKMIVKA
ncbi:NADP-dependent oxidoreductase [Wenyingzhuangia sp. 2_MG-2023]|uniref:NADP-dependent oxidoreductase n=1 Tax=Wenyingzhuangia sp. 2_MG-2023 TaxID=3062639 RepID=UPI0026E35384|nr:NADP-dependent oxidoreductase [Wenyingzhuangia sp. 2_MG-2023]MDO6737457.1 NADP-dependent oxidoreductase [Wenyingzhuangia sp. 2_MG-2023]